MLDTKYRVGLDLSKFQLEIAKISWFSVSMALLKLCEIFKNNLVVLLKTN